MLQIALPILDQVEMNRLNHDQALSLVISTSSPMVFTILLMEWLWEVHSSFMDQLVGGQELCFFSLMSSLEIGDFGILLRSGFSVSKAFFFNLSALVALAGTALALTLGQDSGHSSLIEGFTAGGFMYISVTGVLAETNNSGRTTLVNTVIQLISLVSGMAVALCISLVE